MHERDAVSNLFPPPTANQSWRKVLSMGNLLNGHEPLQREIIFSVQERISNGHYSSPTPLCTDDEQIQTHRMYISGTSNDLWVALSVTSWDWAAHLHRRSLWIDNWCRRGPSFDSKSKFQILIHENIIRICVIDVLWPSFLRAAGLYLRGLSRVKSLIWLLLLL